MNYKVYMHIFPNNKKYIGITNLSVERRWRNNGYGYERQVVYNAIKKYGWENIKHEILFENLTKEQAEQKEIELIALYKSNQREFGYNIANGGNTIGTHSELSKQKMSMSRKGKYTGSKNPMYNKHLSEQSRHKISIANKGRKRTQEAIKKTASKLIGQKRSIESRMKMSNAAKGKIVSIETRKKLSIIGHNRKQSEITRKKISEGNKGKHNVPCSEATKQKISFENSGSKNYFYGKHHTIETKKILSNKLSKPIICIETNIIYLNPKQACIELGKKDRTNIAAALRGKSKTAYGYHWRYLDE